MIVKNTISPNGTLLYVRASQEAWKQALKTLQIDKEIGLLNWQDVYQVWQFFKENQSKSCAYTYTYNNKPLIANAKEIKKIKRTERDLVNVVIFDIVQKKVFAQKAQERKQVAAHAKRLAQEKEKILQNFGVY